MELALFVVGGAVERAFQVTEQLAFDQILRDGGAVHFHEHLVFPQALSMDGMGHEFFARTRPAINQHTTISRRHETDLLAQRFHWNAVAYDHTLELELLLEVPIFLAESLCLDCVLNEDESLVERQRLFQKIVCAELGGTDRGLDRAVPGDHDDLGSIFEFPDPLQGFQTIDTRKPDIEQNQVEKPFVQHVKAALARSRH